MMSLREAMLTTRPRLTRIHGDENAFEIIAAVGQAIVEVGRAIDADPAEARGLKQEVAETMMSGDYENLLETARGYVKFADDPED